MRQTGGPVRGLRRGKRKSRLRAKRVYAIGQQQQDAASARRRRQAVKTRRLRVAGGGLMLVGLVVGIVHVFSHLLVLRFLPLGWQDLLIGYPTAGALILTGFVLFGR